MKKNLFYLSCLSIVMLVSCRPNKPKSASDWSTYSPDSTLKFICNNLNGNIQYMLLSGSDTLLYPSKLGLETDKQSFYSDLSFVDAKQAIVNESYEMKVGKKLNNTYTAQELLLTFQNKESVKFIVTVRLSNDGLAFKYSIPEYKDTLHIINEQTTFAVSPDAKSWLPTHDLPTEWGPAYETYYTAGVKAGTPANDSSGFSFPALFEANNHWLLLSESNLQPNYFAVHLEQNCGGGVYKVRKPEKGEGLGTGINSAKTIAPFDSPWRVVIVGKSIHKIVESNLVHDLADANKIGDVSWVKPGRASWNWWGEHDGSKKFSSLKNFVDLAKEFNWEYSLVDANWDMMTDGGNIEDLTKYAQKQNIGLSLWYNSGGPHNKVSERPRDVMYDPILRKAEFKKLNEWGVKAIKIDFFQSDKQDVIKLYHDILVDAAAAKIMVVFHGCTLPRGWARTYPNLVSMEAIKGAEQYGWSKEFAQLAPAHNTVVAFSRNVVGSMDYTPVTFSSYEGQEHTTTNAHELALATVFESGILHFADRAYSYRALDNKVKAFMSQIPVAWDDTKLIDGYPGKLFVVARKKQSTWYVSGINGENISKTIDLNLSFLETGKAYTFKIFKDGAKANEIISEEIEYKPGNPFSLAMLPNGGFSIQITAQ